MITWIKKKRNQRTKERYEKEYDIGYSYAAGKVLKGHVTAKLLDTHELVSQLDNGPFEVGFSDALRDGIQKGLVTIESDNMSAPGTC